MGRFGTCAVLALALSLPLAACDEDGGTGVESGTMSVLLTDAPGDFEAAVVTISEIYLQAGEGEDDGRVVLLDGPVTTSLLDLSNDVQTLVEDVTVPGGSYSQLRFVITGGYLAVENEVGNTEVWVTSGYEPPAGFEYPAGSEIAGELHMPSLAESGLKVNLPGGTFRIQSEQKVLLVDFDVAQSFGQEAGASGRWVMSPVLHAEDLGLTGSIEATLGLGADVDLPIIGGAALTLGDFRVRLTNEAGSEEELTLTDADEDGVFEAEFRYLIPGEFTVEFVVPAGVAAEFDPALPLEVTVTSGATAEVDATVTSVTELTT